MGYFIVRIPSTFTVVVNGHNFLDSLVPIDEYVITCPQDSRLVANITKKATYNGVIEINLNEVPKDLAAGTYDIIVELPKAYNVKISIQLKVRDTSIYHIGDLFLDNGTYISYKDYVSDPN